MSLLINTLNSLMYVGDQDQSLAGGGEQLGVQVA